MGNGKENPRYYYLKDIYNNFNSEYGHIEGVFEVLKQFMCLWEENYWESLFMVHKNWTNPLNDPLRKGNPEMLVLLQAIKNGIDRENLLIEYSVDFDAFLSLYIFFEKLYSFYLGRKLVEDDLWALHNSDLAERVLGVLDQFDIFKGSIFLKDDFYQFIKAVSWNMEAKSFYIEFQNLFSTFLFENQGNHEINFNQEINRVLVLLTYSGAVWSDSQQIHTQHVIKAYKTLFKIITTDITLMVDKRYYTGQLVCETCNETYTLLEDEAPYDFSKCGCGGDLSYINRSWDVNKNVR